ncbi:hypothetical protein PV11_00208 [Exophiala sideris]|uniref:Uncharacterized protein n=1 Tax=Exophiala sideris TaxID=1016849 RepID=A0A0D1ZCD7_9EURO|nr:hypothetical protein PV11_00208 [Exophiala sideris]
MSREVIGTVDVSFLDHIKQDIIDHRNESTYDVVYLSAVPNSRHNLHIQIPRYSDLDFDNPDSWSRALLYAYAKVRQPTLKVDGTFIITEICKPACVNPKHGM